MPHEKDAILSYGRMSYSLQLDWGLVWLPRSPLPLALVWLGESTGRTVAGRQQGCDIGDRSRHGTGYFRGQAHPHFPFLFLFSSSSSGFGHAALFLAVRSLRVFPAHFRPPGHTLDPGHPSLVFGIHLISHRSQSPATISLCCPLDSRPSLSP